MTETKCCYGSCSGAPGCFREERRTHSMTDCPSCGGTGYMVMVRPDCCGGISELGYCRGDCAVPREEIWACKDCGGVGKVTVGEHVPAEPKCVCEDGHDRPHWKCPRHGDVVVDT